MENFIIDKDLISYGERRIKFGIEYSEAVYDDGERRADILHFYGCERLNGILIRIAEHYFKVNKRIRIKLIYADEKFMSLDVDGKIIFNCDLSTGCLMPPKFVLKSRGVSERKLKRFVKSIKGNYRADFNTLRFAKNGVRIDALDLKNAQKITVKL